MRGGVVLVFVACASPSPRAVAVTPPDDESAWVDLETMSVNLRDKRVRTLHHAVEPLEPRLEVTHGGDGGTTVRDVEQRNATMTFHESIRWVGGYRWSSGDLLLSTDERLARIEFTSTDPAYVGQTIWQEEPLSGSRTAALLMGPMDTSPNEAPKRAAFAGYEPSGDAPIEVAVIEALGRESFRTTLATRRRCSRREVLLVMWRPRELAVVVACPEGADIERVDF